MPDKHFNRAAIVANVNAFIVPRGYAPMPEPVDVDSLPDSELTMEQWFDRHGFPDEMLSEEPLEWPEPEQEWGMC